MSTTFPALLRASMVRGGWTNRRLGAAVGRNHSIIGRYCNDLRQPSRLVVEDIAAALDLTPAESDALYIAAGIVPSDIPTPVLVAALTEARKRMTEGKAA